MRDSEASVSLCHCIGTGPEPIESLLVLSLEGGRQVGQQSLHHHRSLLGGGIGEEMRKTHPYTPRRTSRPLGRALSYELPHPHTAPPRRSRRRPSFRMRLRWANSISTRLRSRRDCSKASVPANARAASRATMTPNFTSTR